MNVVLNLECEKLIWRGFQWIIWILHLFYLSLGLFILIIYYVTLVSDCYQARSWHAEKRHASIGDSRALKAWNNSDVKMACLNARFPCDDTEGPFVAEVGAQIFKFPLFFRLIYSERTERTRAKSPRVTNRSFSTRSVLPVPVSFAH